MIIRVRLLQNSKDCGGLGDIYIKSNNENFIDEIQKYTCPTRMIEFISSQDLDICAELLSPPNNNSFDLEIDLSKKLLEQMGDLSLPFSVKMDSSMCANNTSHLDKYGNAL
ncbi:MAG: hypothetical protein RBR02_09290 [Desulfuromonadaceae bacterium]|nr:hypothetical protein [Desulfuromonadaceae bacterium]